MKKILSILSVLIIILTLFTSCNSVSEPTEKPSETSSPSETVDRKPTERPTQKPTEKPTEEPIVIPPREVTWDTSKYEAFYVPHGYLLGLKYDVVKYISTLREQEGEPIIPTVSCLYEVDTPEETTTVKFLGEEYTGNYTGYSSILPAYATAPNYRYNVVDLSSTAREFTINENGELSSISFRVHFSEEKPIATVEECEEKAKECFSMQLPELDMTEYKMRSSVLNNGQRYIVFTKYYFEDFAQESVSFRFTANGELMGFSYDTYTKPSDKIDVSKIDMNEVYETFRKVSEYTFHAEKTLYPNDVITVPDELYRAVLSDGSIAFHGEIKIVSKYDISINIAHLFIKIIPQE